MTPDCVFRFNLRTRSALKVKHLKNQISEFNINMLFLCVVLLPAGQFSVCELFQQTESEGMKACVMDSLKLQTESLSRV